MVDMPRKMIWSSSGSSLPSLKSFFWAYRTMLFHLCGSIGFSFIIIRPAQSFNPQNKRTCTAAVRYRSWNNMENCKIGISPPGSSASAGQ